MSGTGAALSLIYPPTGVSTASRFEMHGREYLVVVRVSIFQIYEVSDDTLRYIMSQSFTERIMGVFPRKVVKKGTGADEMQFVLCFDSHKTILYGFAGFRLIPITVYSFTLEAEENMAHENPSYALYDNSILVCICGAIRSHIGLAHLDTGNMVILPFIGDKILDIQCLPRTQTCAPQLGVLVSFPIPAQRWARNARAGHLHMYTIEYNQAGSMANRSPQRDGFTITLQHKVMNIPSDSYCLSALTEPLNMFLVHSTRVFVMISAAERVAPPLYFRFSFLPEEQTISNLYISDAIQQCVKTQGTYISPLADHFAQNTALKLTNNRLLSIHNSVLTLEKTQLNSVHRATLPIAPTLMPGHPFKGGSEYPYYGYSIDRPDESVCLSQVSSIIGGFPTLDLHLYMEACGSAHIDDLLCLENRLRSSITPGEYINMSAFGKYPSNMEFIGPRADVLNYIQIPPLSGTRVCYLQNNAVDQKGWHNILVVDNRGLSFVIRMFIDNGSVAKQKLEMYPVCLCDRNAAVTTGSPATLIQPTVLVSLSPGTAKDTELEKELERAYYALENPDARNANRTASSLMPYVSLPSARVFIGSLVDDSMLYSVSLSTATPQHGYYHDYRPVLAPDETAGRGNLEKLAQALCTSAATAALASAPSQALALSEASLATAANSQGANSSFPLPHTDAHTEAQQVHIFGEPFSVDQFYRQRIFLNARLLKPFSGSILRLIERQTIHPPAYSNVLHGLVFPYAVLPSLSGVKDSSAKPVTLDDQKDANARPRLHLLHEAGAVSMISSYATAISPSHLRYMPNLNKVGDRAAALLDDYTCNFYHMNPDANNPWSLKTLTTETDAFNFLVTSRVETAYASVLKDNDLFNASAAKKDVVSRYVSAPIVTNQPTLLAFTTARSISVQVCPQTVEFFVCNGKERVSLPTTKLLSECRPRLTHASADRPILVHAESDFSEYLVATTASCVLLIVLPKSVKEITTYNTMLHTKVTGIRTMMPLESFYSTAFLSAKSSAQLLECLSLSNMEASVAEYMAKKMPNIASQDLFMNEARAMTTAIQANQVHIGCVFIVTSSARVICVALFQHKDSGAIAYIPIWVWQVYEQNFFEKDYKSKISFRTNAYVTNLLPYYCDHGMFAVAQSGGQTSIVENTFIFSQNTASKDIADSAPYSASYIDALFDTQLESITSEMTPESGFSRYTQHLNGEINARRVSSIYVACPPVVAQYGNTGAASAVGTNITILVAYFGGSTSMHRLGAQIDAPHKLCVTVTEGVSFATQTLAVKAVDAAAPPELCDMWAEPATIVAAATAAASSSGTGGKTASAQQVSLRLSRPFRPIYLLDMAAQGDGMALPLIFIGTPRPTANATLGCAIAMPNLSGAYSVYTLGRIQSYILLNKKYSIPIQSPVRQMLPLFYTPGCSFPACLDLMDSKLPLGLTTQGNCPAITSNFSNVPYVYLHRNGLDLGGIEHTNFGMHLLYKGVCEKEYKDMVTNRCFLHRRTTHARKNTVYNLLYLASFGNNTQMPVRTLLNLPPGLRGSKMCYHTESDTFTIVMYTERYEVRAPRSVAKDEVAGIKVSEELKMLRDCHRIGDTTEDDIRANMYNDGDTAQLEAYKRYKEEGLAKAKEIMLVSPPTYNSFMKTRLEVMLLIAHDQSINKYRVSDYYLYDLKRSETSTSIVADVVDSQFPRRFGSGWRHDGGVSRDSFGCINRRNYHNSQSSDQTGAKPREVLRSGSKELILLGTGYLLGPDEKCYGTCKILAVEKADKNDDVKANRWNLGGWGSFYAFRLITQEEFQNIVASVRSFPAAHVIIIGENKRICAYHLEDSKRLTCCSIFERCGSITNISRFNEFISISDFMLRNGLYVFRSRGSRNNSMSYSSNDLPIYLSEFLVSGITKEMNVVGISLHRIVCLLSYPYTKTSQRLVSQLAVQCSCKIPWTCVSAQQVAGWVNASEADDDRLNKGAKLTSNANCTLVCAEGAIVVTIPIPIEIEQFLEAFGAFRAFDVGPHCLARKKKGFDKKLVYDAARLIILQSLDCVSREYVGLGSRAANVRNFSNLVCRLVSDSMCF